MSISQYILGQYLTGKSVGVQIYLREIDTFYKEKSIKELSKLSETLVNEISTKLLEIQETQQRIRQDQDKLVRRKSDLQYNDMQQWGIELSIEKIIEIDSKMIRLTKLLTYIAESRENGNIRL